MTKSLSSRDVQKMLKTDGWVKVGATGDDIQFKHPAKKGRVTLQDKRKDVPIKTLRSIYRQAGWDWSKRR